MTYHTFDYPTTVRHSRQALALAHEDARRWGELVGHIPRFQLQHLRSLAVLAEWDEDTAQAITCLEEAQTLAEQIGLPGERWPILVKLGELYRAIGEQAQAQKARGKAGEIIQDLAARIDDEGLWAGFLAAESIRPILASRGSRNAPF